MAFNFPNSPTNGQLYQPLSGGPIYVYQSGTWRVQGGGIAGVAISDTPPANPIQGQLWWESDTGKTYIWYDDGTSAQWVQFNVADRPAGVVKRTIITATTAAFQFDPSSQWAEVEVVGGGGGTGGTLAGALGQNSVTAGGQGGSYGKKAFQITDTIRNATKTITIGSGGAAGASNSAGSDGGNSSYADTVNNIVAPGGAGASHNASSTQFLLVTLNPSALNGPGTGGDINLQGMVGPTAVGGGSVQTGSSSAALAAPGNGGDTPLGRGGRALATSTTTSGGFTARTAPSANGGGGAAGSGAYNTASTQGGQAGAAGCVVITEYA